MAFHGRVGGGFEPQTRALSVKTYVKTKELV